MKSALKSKLAGAATAALKQGRKQEVGALRLILAATQRQEIDTRTEIDDATALAILGKLAKQHRGSISHFEKAGRDDLVAQEQFELELLKSYLPAALSDAETDAAIQEAIVLSGAKSPKELGKVMGLLRKSLQGRADLGSVSVKVKAQLAD